MMLCLGVHAGCTDATGGAVELSWALRSTNDRDISDCDGGKVGSIRLWWDTGTTMRDKDFACRDNHGVTAFDLPVGQVALWVTPVCADGTEPDVRTFETPPPIERQVSVGQTIELDAVLLVLQVDDCDQKPCACP